MAPSRESTMTPVERPFPATHARNQRLSSQEPNEEVERDPPAEDINLPANMEEENWDSPPTPTQAPPLQYPGHQPSGTTVSTCQASKPSPEKEVLQCEGTRPF